MYELCFACAQAGCPVKSTSRPTLYSFRRCPYAMRARWALLNAGLLVEWREVDLKSKPLEMTKVSKKGTVPVLVCLDGTVLEESLEIMYWAFEQADPFELMPISQGERLKEIKALIAENDGLFKRTLDRFKYTDRYPGESKEEHQKSGLMILEEWNKRLEDGGWLVGNSMSIADIAIWPFVRQWCNTDPDAFVANSSISLLKIWLERFTQDPMFERLMIRSKVWQPSMQEMLFPADSAAVPCDQPIFHLAMDKDWQEAKTKGSYTISTLGMHLKQVGFIHASWAHQVSSTFERFYRDSSDLVLLKIDPSRLNIPLRADAAANGELFPHLYGPLPIAAISEATPFVPGVSCRQL
ncbi:MAG: DUF952 domain-containing protein [Prochlorococcus sp.]